MGVYLRRHITGHSVIGARHVQMGTPCQDAIFIENEEDISILCAADGHGDEKHSKSDEGAQAAVEVAGSLLKQALQDLRHDRRTFREIELGIREHLPRRIAWEWNRKVQKTQDGYWSRDVILYGCTILAAAISSEMSIFVQLGDGDMLFINEEGNAEFIFPPDEDMYGTVTHSLCQPNIAQNTKISVRTLPQPKLFLMSTDGLRDSLQDDAQSYINVGKWLLKRFQSEGFYPIQTTLPNWLSQLSERGNGDDTTMGLLIWESVNNNTFLAPTPQKKSYIPSSQSTISGNPLLDFFCEPESVFVEHTQNKNVQNPLSISTKEAMGLHISLRTRNILAPRFNKLVGRTKKYSRYLRSYKK